MERACVPPQPDRSVQSRCWALGPTWIPHHRVSPSFHLTPQHLAERSHHKYMAANAQLLEKAEDEESKKALAELNGEY